MEKRISPTEWRLGFNIDWKQQFFTSKKFYNDSIKMSLFTVYFFNGLQKEFSYIIPTSLIKIFISNEFFLINYIYINDKIKIKPKLTTEETNVKINDEDLYEKITNTLKELYYTKKLYQKNRRKKKKFINFPFLKKKWKKKIIFIKKLVIKKKKFNFIITKLIKKKPSISFFFNLSKKLLNKKLYEENLITFFILLTNKKCYINNLNITQLLAKNPNTVFKNFYEIRNWYKKIGGKTFNFHEKLLTTYYALTYKNCMNLYLSMIKKNIEQNITKQKQNITESYNILFAYTWVQRNIEGLKINFKGTIGRHGRAKTITFLLGGLYQASLIRQVEYYYTKIDTKFGCISMKVWCVFND